MFSPENFSHLWSAKEFISHFAFFSSVKYINGLITFFFNVLMKKKYSYLQYEMICPRFKQFWSFSIVKNTNGLLI